MWLAFDPLTRQTVMNGSVRQYREANTSAPRSALVAAGVLGADTERFIFPAPTWKQRQCRAFFGDSPLQECSGNGACSLEGVCVCAGEYTGRGCQLLVQTVEVGEDLTVTPVPWVQHSPPARSQGRVQGSGAGWARSLS